MHIGCVVFLLNVDFHYLVSNACFFKYAINSAYLFDQVENPEQSLRKKSKNNKSGLLHYLYVDK